MKVWVLTREHNGYDQHGSYFEAVFAKKPTLEVLASYFRNTEANSFGTDMMGAIEFLEHLRKGGGRREAEDVWYTLEEVECK